MSTGSGQKAQRDRRPFQIAGWLADPTACRLEKDGEMVRIEPKVMKVLEYLVEHVGQVVSRQDLEKSVWSGTVVGYEAVTNAVIKLRKALGDDARDPHIIETISKHGYRLVAEVTLEGQRSNGHRPGRSRAAAGLGWYFLDRPDFEPASIKDMSFPLPKEPSVAVLPFGNLSGETWSTRSGQGL